MNPMGKCGQIAFIKARIHYISTWLTQKASKTYRIFILDRNRYTLEISFHWIFFSDHVGRNKPIDSIIHIVQFYMHVTNFKPTTHQITSNNFK